MKRLVLGSVLSLALASSQGAAAGASNPCVGVEGWRAGLCAYAKTNLVHPAWGYEHSLRDYTLATELAKESQIAVDDDVLFAAAMLHDLGGFEPFSLPGVDHALRSTQLSDDILRSVGFPMQKGKAVKAAMLNHSYYDDQRPATAEGIVLHDADGLDFLGAVSAMRILSLVGKESFTPHTAAALNLLKNLKAQVPASIYGGPSTQKRLQERLVELGSFLNAVERETYGFGIPGSPEE